MTAVQNVECSDTELYKGMGYVSLLPVEVAKSGIFQDLDGPTVSRICLINRSMAHRKPHILASTSRAMTDIVIKSIHLNTTSKTTDQEQEAIQLFSHQHPTEIIARELFLPAKYGRITCIKGIWKSATEIDFLGLDLILKSFPSITHLDLRNIASTSAIDLVISTLHERLPNLVSLGLPSTHFQKGMVDDVVANDITELQDFEKLTHLYLDKTQIDNEMYQKLPCNSVRSICISSDVTPDLVPILPNLETLKVHNNLTVIWAHALEKKFPKAAALRVERFIEGINSNAGENVQSALSIIAKIPTVKRLVLFNITGLGLTALDTYLQTAPVDQTVCVEECYDISRGELKILETKWRQRIQVVGTLEQSPAKINQRVLEG